MRPGEHHVSFRRDEETESGRRYLPEETGPLLVDRATATVAVDAAMVPGASLAGGIVAPPGHFPPRAEILVTDVADGTLYKGAVLAMSEDRWRVSRLPPGTYRVRIDRPGEIVGEGEVKHAPAGYVATWLGDALVEEEAETFTVEAGEVRDVGTVQLADAAGIRGDLREAVTGRPIPSACLTVTDPAGRTIAQVTHFASNPGVRFRLDHLPPVELRLLAETPACTQPSEEPTHLPRWLGGSSLEEATPIALRPDEILTDADLDLERRTPPGRLDADVVEQVGRVAGRDRIETAAELAEGGWPDGAPAVVLASADASIDALTGGPLAAAVGGPVLLTGATGLDPVSRAAVERLRPLRAFVVGGEAVVSPQVEVDLADAGIQEVVRIAGADRIATAALVAERLLNKDGSSLKRPSAFLVSAASGSPDAAAIAGVAAARRAPILLTYADVLPPATAALLDRVGQTVVVGGSARISEDVLRTVGAASGAVSRIAGGDRYATSEAIVEELGTGSLRPWLVTGKGWADALAAGPAVARDGGVLLLVPGHEPPTAADLTRLERVLDTLEEDYLFSRLDRILLIGGRAAIDEEWERALRSAALARRGEPMPEP